MSPEVRRLVEKADAEFQRGNLEGARTILREALEAEPENPDILRSVGSLAFKLDDFSEAADRFLRVTQLLPNDASGFVQLALAKLRLDRVEDFETALGRALELEPENRDALKLLGDLNFQQGKIKDAGHVYSRILSRDPSDVEVLLALGVCFFKGGDLEMAKTVFERVLVHSPDHPVAKENLAVIREKLSGSEASKPAAETARQSETAPVSLTEEVERLIRVAEEHYENGQFSEAKDLLLEAHKMSPTDLTVLSSLAAVSDALQDLSSTRDYLKQALKIKGDDPDILVRIALIELKQDEIEAFERVLAKALEIDPHHKESLKLLADLNFRNERFKDAAQTYTSILTHYPDDLESMVRLGTCFAKTGDNETAKLVFERALQQDPNCATAKENLARIRAEVGEVAEKSAESIDISAEVSVLPDLAPNLQLAPETAAKPKETKDLASRLQDLVDEANFFSEVDNHEASLDALERAEELSPKDTRILSAVGSLHFTMGNYEASRQKFRRVIELKPRDADAYIRLAMACLKLDRIEEMEAALGIALEIDPNHREALKFLAKTNLESDRVRDAGRTYAKLLEQQPDDVESLLALGLCFFKGGDLSAARMVYNRILEYDPNNATAHENLAQIKEAKEKPSGHRVEEPSRGPLKRDSDRSSKINRFLTAAEEAFGKQNLAAARDALKSALELSPEAPELLAALGSLHFQLGEMRQARDTLKRLVERAPADPGKWVQLALAHYQLDEIEEFETALGRALELDPDHLEALRLLAHLSFNHGNLVDAAHSYGKILKQLPDDLEVITALGVCFFKTGDNDAAKMMFERVLELDPSNALASENLGVVKSKISKEQAPAPESGGAEASESAESADPVVELESPKASETMARVDELLTQADKHASEGNVEKACGLLKTAADIEPNTHEIHAALGSLTFQLGDSAASFQALTRAVELAPESADYQTRLAISLLALDRVDEFATALGRALEIDKDYRPALRLLADLNFRQERFKDAAHTYHRLLVKTPDDVEVMLPLAVCFYRTGDADASKMVFDRILTLDPENTLAKENRRLLDELSKEETPRGEGQTGGKLDSASEQTAPGKKVSVVWEGSQFVHHSLALVNRELCLRLIGAGHQVSIAPYEPDQFGPELDPRFEELSKSIRRSLPGVADVHVRHQWPFNPTPPPDGRWVVIQPWEYGSLPKEWLPVLKDEVDEVWVPSCWARSCYIQSGMPREKVFVVPNGVDPKKYHPGVAPFRLSTKKKFKFLFVGGLLRRKGVDILLNAYLRRFKASDDVCLVIKSFGKELYRDDSVISQIRKVQSAPNSPEILLLDQDLPPDDLPGLYAACDCLAHPYRGEGFGLPILEAMACGVPVIVTAGGASDEFATDDLAYRIPAVKKPIGTKVIDLELVSEGWLLEPDPAALEERMAWVVSHSKEAKDLGLRAGEVVRSHWSWSAAGAKAAQRLIELSNQPGPPVRERTGKDAQLENRSGEPGTVEATPGKIEVSATGVSQEPGDAVQKDSIRETPGTTDSAGEEAAIPVVWEGPQLSHHSLALINRELCLNLLMEGKTELSIWPIGAEAFGVEADSRFERLKRGMGARPSRHAKVHIRHQWPLSVVPPEHGYWVVMQPWEYGAIPKEWVAPLQDRVDEIWAYTNFVRDTYVRCGIPPEKVFVVPCGIHPEKFHPGVRKVELATTKRFRFLFVGGTILRKGPDLLLDSYLRVFSAADDVCLVIKDFGNNEVYKGQTIEKAIREAQKKPNAPEILYLTKELTPEELPSLYAACDCLVHPYRGEGFALPVLEAMGVGLPVIVTAGGSTDDFALEAHAYRIPAKKSPVSNWAGPELVDQPWWLEPNSAALDERMRDVFNKQDEARKRGLAASDYVRKNWTWEHAASKARERISKLAAKTEDPIRFRVKTGAPAVTGGEAEVEVPEAGRLGSLQDVHQFVERKKYSKAWNCALEAIKLRPFHPDAYMQMADIALRAGDEQIAFACAERLIKMTPQWEMALQLHRSLGRQKKRKKSRIKWTPLPELPKSPRLTVCLIAKDEEEHIGRCLTSVKAIASQIVVVDTGSKDRTAEIAKEHGAEVHHFAWNDNFSDARNKAQEYARGDWVLILDSDEELPVESHKQLAEDITVSNMLGFRIPICNLHESDDSVTYVPRLFRNAPALFFVGRVHEQIYASVVARKSEWGMEAGLGTARIVHHGYDPGLVKRRQKVKRNLRLLEKAVQETPNEAALVMNYGLDLVNDGRLEEGLAQYRRAFCLMEPHPAEALLPEVRERLLTIFGVHLTRAERFEEVVKVMGSRLAADCGPTASLHFLAAAALMKLERTEEAIPHLKECLTKRNQPTLTPPCPQIFKGGPRHLLAQCYAKLKRPDAAEAEFKEALNEDPDSTGLLHDYAYFLHQARRSLEALQVLHGVLGKGVDDLRVWHLGCLIANSRPEFNEFALDWTTEAIKFCPDHSGVALARGEALLKAGRVRESVPFFRLEAHADQPAAKAAVILAELVEGKAKNKIPADEEPIVSREFIGWYRRLLATKAQRTILAINAKVDSLRDVLPTASEMLAQALKEAGGSE